MYSPKLIIQFLVLMGLYLFGFQVSAQGLVPRGVRTTAIVRNAPLDVAIGIEINQISFVEQKSENFGVVATIRARWNDPALAFDAEAFGREYRVMKPTAFIDYATNLAAIVPGFVIQNQQSNRWIHQSLVVAHANGDAQYLEKSSLTLQAPDFNFFPYPFDRQDFYFEIVSVYPSSLVTYSVLTEFSGSGDKLGEEEWVLSRDSRVGQWIEVSFSI